MVFQRHLVQDFCLLEAKKTSIMQLSLLLDLLWSVKCGDSCHMKYIRFTDVQAYKTALELTNDIWNLVERWNHFHRETMGIQFAKAADSISANIAEGFGRYHKKDKIKFYHYALGSRSETCDWVEKAYVRRLITKEQHANFIEKLEQLRPGIWGLIKITEEKLAI